MSYYGGPNSGNMQGNVHQRGGFQQQHQQPQQQPQQQYGNMAQGGRMNNPSGGGMGYGGNPGGSRPVGAGNPGQGMGGGNQVANEWEQFFGQPNASRAPIDRGPNAGSAPFNQAGPASEQAMKQMLSSTLNSRPGMNDGLPSGGMQGMMRGPNNFGPGNSGPMMQRPNPMMGNMGGNAGGNMGGTNMNAMSAMGNMGPNMGNMNPNMGMNKMNPNMGGGMGGVPMGGAGMGGSMGGGMGSNGGVGRGPMGGGMGSDMGIGGGGGGGGGMGRGPMGGGMGGDIGGGGGMGRGPMGGDMSGSSGGHMGGNMARGMQGGMGGPNMGMNMNNPGMMGGQAGQGNLRGSMGMQGPGGSGGGGGGGGGGGYDNYSYDNEYDPMVMGGGMGPGYGGGMGGSGRDNGGVGVGVGGGGGFGSGMSMQGNPKIAAINNANNRFVPFPNNSMMSRHNSKWSSSFESLIHFPVTFATPLPPPMAPSPMAAAVRSIDPAAFMKKPGGFSAPSAMPTPTFGRAGKPSSFSNGPSNFSPALATAGHKRERSRSPMYSRSRSRSPSPRRGQTGRRGRADSRTESPPRTKRGRSPLRPTAAGTGGGGSVSSAGATANQAAAAGSALRKPFAYSSLTFPELLQSFNYPIVQQTMTDLRVPDLQGRFPSLYLPADLVSVKMDWQNIGEALHYDVLVNLTASAPVLFESTPASTVNAEDLRSHFFSDMMDPPRVTYLSHNTINNALSDSTLYSVRLRNLAKPVKFNAKVLICCGVKDAENERIDNLLPRKLLMLCGRKRNGHVLLGGAWNHDLDGGDPLVDRSCLLNTARRTVYAQTLIDIARGDVQNNLVRLCEVTYHRPKEEIKNKSYPEQMEISVVYLYTLQENVLEGMSPSDWEADWTVFQRRARGVHVGPMLGRSPEAFAEDLLQDQTYIEEIEHRLGVDGAAASRKEESGEKEAAGSAPASDGTSHSHSAENGNGETAAMDANNGAAAETVDGRPSGGSHGDDNSNEDSAHANEAVDSQSTTSKPAAEHPGGEAGEGLILPPAEGDHSSAKPLLTARPLHVTRPDHPTVLICPMPLPPDVFQDANKRQDGLSLRMIPLASILAYSLDDSSERIFEASLAAELTRSLLSLAYANIVTDFLLAENAALSLYADIRICEAVKKLRELNMASKAKVLLQSNAETAAPATSASSAASAETGAGKGQEGAAPVADAQTEEAPEGAEVLEAKGDRQGEQGQQDGGEAMETTEQDTAAEDQAANHDSVEHDGDGEAHHETTMESSSSSSSMSEEDARKWRRSFVAACRWFDIPQERALRSETLQMIVHVSSRNLRRGDVSALVASVVGEAERLRYEIYI